MTKNAEDWLKPNPVVIDNEKDYFAYSPALARLEANYRYCVEHFPPTSSSRAAYFGGGGGFVSSEFVGGKILTVPGVSSPINWGCHARLDNLTICGEVMTVWERGDEANRHTFFRDELIQDIHFSEELPFHKILKDAIILLDGKGRVLATTFLNYNKRPQKLCAMFFIACRQAHKDSKVALYYWLGKKAGLTKTESFFLASGTGNVEYHLPNQQFILDTDATTPEIYLEAATRCLCNAEKMSGVKAENSIPYCNRFNFDTGDGPMGTCKWNRERSLCVYSYPSFKEFKDGLFNIDYLNKSRWDSPQPSNACFIQGDSASMTSGKFREEVVSLSRAYVTLLYSAVCGLKDVEEKLAILKEKASKDGLFFAERAIVKTGEQE